MTEKQMLGSHQNKGMKRIIGKEIDVFQTEDMTI